MSAAPEIMRTNFYNLFFSKNRKSRSLLRVFNSRFPLLFSSFDSQSIGNFDIGVVPRLMKLQSLFEHDLNLATGIIHLNVERKFVADISL